MEVIFLGTGGSVPLGKRNPFSIAVKLERETILLDVGEGTQFKIVKARAVFGRPMKILLSHLHGDHILGLPGLLQSMQLSGRKSRLEIYGPPGTAIFVEFHRKFFHMNLDFDLEVCEITGKTQVERQTYTLNFFEVKHNVYTLGVILQEKARRGKFNRERAEELGIPPRLRSHLVKGQPVRVGSRVIQPHEVIEPPRPGRKLVYIPDTMFFDDLVGIAKNADLVIYNATFSIKDVEHAKRKCHSTVEDVVTLCNKSNARLIVATHISSRYNKLEEYLEGIDVPENLIVAEDMLRVVIPFPERGKPTPVYPG